MCANHGEGVHKVITWLQKNNVGNYFYSYYLFDCIWAETPTGHLLIILSDVIVSIFKNVAYKEAQANLKSTCFRFVKSCAQIFISLNV